MDVSSIPNNKKFYLLDALDEEWNKPIDSVFQNIVKVAKSNPQSIFLVGCRLRHVNILSNSWAERNDAIVSFRKILPLTNEQTRKGLEEAFLGNPSEWVNQTISICGNKKHISYQNNKAFIYFESSLLHTPRYLNYLCQIVLSKKGVAQLISPKLKRPSFGFIMELVIDLKLKEEFEKEPLKNYLHGLKYHIEAAKLLQQKIALFMHLRAQTYFTEAEMAVILAELNSQEPGRFHGIKEARYFYERSLMKSSNGYLEFDNQDILDYLAAKELERLGEVQLPYVIGSFCVHEQTNYIGRVWWESLLFICDQSPDFQFLEVLLDHVESLSLSRRFPPTKTKGSFAQSETLIHRIIGRLDARYLPFRLKQRLFKFIINFIVQYYPQMYGKENDVEILARLIDLDTISLLNDLFQQKHHKLVLAILMEYTRPFENDQSNIIRWSEWEDRFLNLILSNQYPEDTTFLGHIISTFFDPYRFISFEKRLQEAKTGKFLQERNVFALAYIPVFDKYQEKINNLDENLKQAFYFHRIKSLEQSRPYREDIIEAYIDWYHLFPTTKSIKEGDLLNVYLQLLTKNRWQRFLNTFLSDNEFRAGVFSFQNENHIRTSKVEEKKEQYEKVFSILSNVVQENREPYRDTIFQSLVISYSKHCTKDNLLFWNPQLVLCFGKILVTYFPELFLTFCETIEVAQNENDIFYLYSSFFSYSSEKTPFQSLQKVFFELSAKYPLAAYRLTELATYYSPEKQKVIEAWQEALPPKKLETFLQNQKVFEVKKNARENLRDQEWEDHQKEKRLELENQIKGYQQDTKGEIRPEQILSWIIQNNYAFSSGINEYEIPVQQILDDYLEAYPDLTKVNVKTSNGKDFATDPPAYIWELQIAVELMRIFPTLYKETYQPKLTHGILVIQHQNGVEWWKTHIWNILTFSEKQELLKKVIHRPDQLIFYNARQILLLFKETKVNNALPVIKSIVEAPIGLSDYSEHISISYLTFLETEFPGELSLSYLKELNDKLVNQYDLKLEIELLLAKKFTDRSILQDKINYVIEHIEHIIDPFRRGLAKPWEDLEVQIRGVGDKEQQVNTWTGVLKVQYHPDLIPDFLSFVEAAIKLFFSKHDVSRLPDIRESATKLIGICDEYLSNLAPKYYHLVMKKWMEMVNLLELKYQKPAYGDAYLHMLLDGTYSLLTAHPFQSKSLSQTIHAYNQFDQQRFTQIRSNGDLQLLLEDIIDEDIRSWVESEGAYRLTKAAKDVKRIEREYIVQVALLAEIKSRLLEHRLDPAYIQLTREEQKMDNKRTDFLVRYGLYGPVIIEVKQASDIRVKINEDGKVSKAAKDYVKIMKNYLEGFNASSGILLVVNLQPKTKVIPKQELLLSRHYQEYLPEIKVIYIDATG